MNLKIWIKDFVTIFLMYVKNFHQVNLSEIIIDSGRSCRNVFYWRLSSQAPKNFYILLFVPRKKFSELDEYIKVESGEMGLIKIVRKYI